VKDEKGASPPSFFISFYQHLRSVDEVLLIQCLLIHMGAIANATTAIAIPVPMSTTLPAVKKMKGSVEFL
jgi:hypothetical protein